VADNDKGEGLGGDHVDLQISVKMTVFKIINLGRSPESSLVVYVDPHVRNMKVTKE
jgi:hypothetical protein